MTVAAIIILVAYIAYAIYKTREIPLCLSDTAYTIGKHTFAVTMLTICALLWCPMLSVTADEWQFLVFLSFTGIAMMAVSPYRDNKITRNIHYVGTLLAMLCVLALWVVKGYWGVPIAVIFAALVYPTKHWLLIVELLMFVVAFVLPFVLTHNS